MHKESLAEKITGWLEKRRAVNLLLIACYFIFIVFMHDHLVHVSMWVEKQLSLPLYNRATAIVYLLFLFVLCLTLWKQFPRYSDNPKLKLAYLATTITLVIIHSRFMFESNIEVIHSFEFTFLTVLLFPLTRRFGASVFFTLPFMLIDEWYQYIYLYPDWNDYLDLNDIVMDTYGSALAMIVLFIAGVKGQLSSRPLFKRPEFIALVCGAVVVAVLIFTGVIAPYLSDKTANTLLVINEGVGPEPFYRAHPTHNIMYHVMKPIEGLVVIGLLHFFYFGLDVFRK